MGRSIFYEPGPNEGFGIVTGDEWTFDIVPWRNVIDKVIQREHPTRLAAVEAHIANLEDERAGINTAIAKAKRLRRAWSKP